MKNLITADYCTFINEVKLNSSVIEQSKLDLLKNKLSPVVNSTRALHYINNIEDLVLALQKRALDGVEKEKALKSIVECIASSRTNAKCYTCQQLPSHVLDLIAEEIGRKWLDLGRYLDLTEGTLAEIEAKYPFSLKQQAYQVLLRFCEGISYEEMTPKLLEALKKSRRVDLRTRVEKELCKGKKI